MSPSEPAVPLSAWSCLLLPFEGLAWARPDCGQGGPAEYMSQVSALMESAVSGKGAIPVQGR